MIDWLAREGWMVLSWWLLVTLAGAAALPLAWRMLGSLPDRGYLLARPLGLLAIGFVYWLLNSLGFLRNDAGSVVLAALIVLAIGLAVYFRVKNYSGREEPDTLGTWWARNRWAIITAEVLFLVMLVGFSAVRAHQNAINSTERPMDLAILAAIVRSDSFPPSDPWMSGYSISYYYFGYAIAAMLTTVSGFFATTTYNLWTATLFALTGLGAFGVVYNLVRVRGSLRAATLTAVLGLWLVAAAGNYLTPFVDEAYFNRTATAEQLTFWDVRDRQTPRPGDVPQWDNGFWWHSARVIQDRNLDGMGSAYDEVINEFPMFSYVLGDNHPHVMSLPFALLSMGIGLSLALNRRRADILTGIFCGVLVGSAIFMNTWDTPIYVLLVVGAEGLRRYLAADGRLTVDDGIELLIFLGLIVGVMIVAYLPFLVSFSSQMSGILPNLIHPTSTQQLFLVFGAAFPLIALFLGVEAWRGGRSLNFKLGAGLAGGFLLVLLALVGVMLLLGSRSPDWIGRHQQFLLQNPDAVGEMFAKRIAYILTTVLLVAGVFITAARLFGKREGKPAYAVSSGYVFLMVGGALLLILTPDYIFLRDGFGSRMNTVFKFYYQAWALLGIASAYGLWSMVDASGERPLPRAGRFIIAGVGILCILPTVLYPLRAINSRMYLETGLADNPNARPITLDGGQSLTNTNDYRALICLRDLTADEKGVVVAEYSFPGSYHYFYGGIGSGRTSGITGLPVVLGWQGHERQWRGANYARAVGSRERDIATLYNDLRMDVVTPIIDAYGIDYIVYGHAERDAHGTEGEIKFRESLEIVCETGDTRIYRTAALNRLPVITQSTQE